MYKTYLQVQKQIETLQREAERLKQQEVAGVIARIKEAIRVYGLTAADLGFGAKAALGRTAGKRSASARALVSAKYQDGAGNTWSGRGPRPHWLRDALAAGARMEQFLVSAEKTKSSRAKPGSGKRRPGRKAGVGKKVGAAKYRDEQGHSWTGMGPKPRWLKDAIAAGRTLEELAVS